MKAVSGTVRLELAQYNELKAFAQFGSDLDDATQKTLRRGSILVEVLKQSQYKPLDVGLQVFVLYAATRGYLDEMQVSDIGPWEKGFHRYLLESQADLLNKIKTGAKLKEIEKNIQAAIETHKERYSVNA